MLIKKYIKSDLIATGPNIWAGRSAEDRLLCKQEAMGSNPIRSTIDFPTKPIRQLVPVEFVGKNVGIAYLEGVCNNCQ